MVLENDVGSNGVRVTGCVSCLTVFGIERRSLLLIAEL